jgi:hypothetical protein
MQDDESLISGHKKLDMNQIGDINLVKHLGKQCRDLFVHLEKDEHGYDQRWIGIARDQMQLGLMALTRAIAKNDFF